MPFPFFNTQNKNYFQAANLVAAIALYMGPKEGPLYNTLMGATVALSIINAVLELQDMKEIWTKHTQFRHGL